MKNTSVKLTKNLEAEVVVIGGGGAGLAAAVSAAENGAKNIIVLEKRGLGGTSALSLGILGAESPVQKRMMIRADKDELFRIAMNYAHYKIDSRIMRAFLDKSGDTIGWLEAKGLVFDVIPLYPGQVPLTWHVPRGYGSALIKVLIKNGKDLGVKLLPQTPARQILVDGKGQVKGVLAETKDGQLLVHTKSVIIASGGFGNNPELMKIYFPHYYNKMIRGGLPHTGDGLIMAEQIGAATEEIATLVASGPALPHTEVLKYESDINNKQTVLLTAIAQEPNTLWVNKIGKRFISEAVVGGHHEAAYAILRQPDAITYTLFDENTRRYMIKNGLFIGMLPNEMEQRSNVPALEKGLEIEEKRGWVKISTSWDEIAEWIGAKPAVLKATIEEYNTSCDAGRDQIFGKDKRYLLPLRAAPFYCIRAHVNYVDTIGPIKINEHMEVLDKRGNSIPGLFAAGVATGGWEADTYCCLLSGTAFGFAINSGRIAGENAAKSIL